MTDHLHNWIRDDSIDNRCCASCGYVDDGIHTWKDKRLFEALENKTYTIIYKNEDNSITSENEQKITIKPVHNFDLAYHITTSKVKNILVHWTVLARLIETDQSLVVDIRERRGLTR